MGFFSNPLSIAASVVNPVAALSTAASMGSGIMDMVAQKQTNDVNQGIANQANQTTLQNNAAQLAFAREQMAMEEEFAKNGLSWRIADAAKSGISPLAAIGASGTGYSPVSYVPGGPTTIPQQASPLTGLSAGFRDMGQNLSRALSATKTPEQRTADALALDRASKENELLDLQIANARLNVAKSASPGIPLAYTSALNRDGTVSVVPTEESARSSHGQFLGPLKWSLDNQLIPSFQDFGTHLLDLPANNGALPRSLYVPNE